MNKFYILMLLVLLLPSSMALSIEPAPEYVCCQALESGKQPYADEVCSNYDTAILDCPKIIEEGNAQLLEDLGGSGAVIGIVLIFFVIFLILGIGMYVYFSIAYMGIGKRAGVKSPGLAWIPSVGPMLIAQRAAKMHWWPILLLIIPFLALIWMLYGLIANADRFFTFPESVSTQVDVGLILSYFVIPVVLIMIVSIILMVYMIIWNWKMFKAVGRPGWWSLLAFLLAWNPLAFVPVVGPTSSLAGLVLLMVFLGIAAWSSPPHNINNTKINVGK